MTSKIVPVILAGGSGTRLWPASRDAFPKQFQPLVVGIPSPQRPRHRSEHPVAGSAADGNGGRLDCGPTAPDALRAPVGAVRRREDRGRAPGTMRPAA